MSVLCKRCKHFPVHTRQGYYQRIGLCLHALMRTDCRRWRTWR